MNAEGSERAGTFVWPPGPSVSPTPPPSNGTSPSPCAPPHWLDASWPKRPSRAAQAIGEVERVLLGGGAVSLQARAAQLGWRPEPVGGACWRCAESVGAFEVDDTGCASCHGTRPPWARFVRLGVYDALLRDAIHELKFQARRGVGMEMGRLLGQRLGHELRSLELGGGVIVPVPISTRRRLQRGVDHTLVLARGVARGSGLPVRPLLRRRHRPSQLSVPLSGREANVRGSIRAGGRKGPPGEGVVVILDDVRTTGATMRAACRAVMGLGVDRERIWACVAAVRDAPDRAGTPGECGEPGSDAG